MAKIEDVKCGDELWIAEPWGYAKPSTVERINPDSRRPTIVFKRDCVPVHVDRCFTTEAEALEYQRQSTLKEIDKAARDVRRGIARIAKLELRTKIAASKLEALP